MSEDPTDPPDRRDEAEADPDDREDPEDRDDSDAPLAGLADRVRRSRSERDSAADHFADLEATEDGRGTADGADGAGAGLDDEADPFEAMDVDTVDEESVWESLEGDAPEVTDQPAVGSGGDAERIDPTDESGDLPEHVVQKSAYCQRCRFLSDPPEVRCTHEGTTILEAVDSERFRVRACPMVEYGGAGSTDRE